jgi:hypothetical protein
LTINREDRSTSRTCEKDGKNILEKTLKDPEKEESQSQ